MTDKTQQQDISNKTILENPVLCCQFIKDNIDIPILKNIQPEDIEDCTEIFRSYFGVEYESDVIKRVRVKDTSRKEQLFEFYLISLIEHKSKVDYNVVVQLLKYITCIWAEYEKTFGTDYKNKVKTKSFRYPPILPIVYYEGTDTWTAALHLKDRIFMNELFEEYIPDFTYFLVNLNDISGEELLERRDEMSLIMLVNKIQNAAELSDFLSLPEEQVTVMMSKSPEAVVDIIVMCMQVLCTKLNLSAEDTEKCIGKVRTKSMGYLWENMEKIDVQAMQREVKDAKQELQTIKNELQEKKQALQSTEQALQSTEQALQSTEQVLQNTERKLQAEREEAEAAKQAAQAEIERLRALLSTHGISQE